MSAAIYHVPPVPLAKLIRRPGGKTISEAVLAADSAIVGMRQAVIDDIRATLLSAEATLASCERLDSAVVQELYLTVTRPIGVASLCSMTEVDQVLTSLATLLDAMKRCTDPDRTAVVLHLQALRLFLAGDGNVERAGSVVTGLEQVTARFCSQVGDEDSAG